LRVEMWARQVVSSELNCPVFLHDDGSQASMYDLRVGPVETPEIAIECVGAVDPIRTETWNLGPANGPLHLRLAGDWTISIVPNARLKPLFKEIEALLQELEHRRLHIVHVDVRLRRYDERLHQDLETLGVAHASCYRLPGSGLVHMSMTGIGGAVDTAGTAVSEWIEGFLRAPKQGDVLFKLARSGAAECHVFVIVDFGGAEWMVEGYLTDDEAMLPATAPTLPAPVTGVWVVHTLGSQGIRWERSGWRQFKVRDIPPPESSDTA
jgi:hypothetical protein